MQQTLLNHCYSFSTFFTHNSLHYWITAKKTPDQPCQGPPTKGYCKKGIWGFTFDSDSNSCKKFMKGGCSMTSNGFRKKEDCDAKCSTSIVKRKFICFKEFLKKRYDFKVFPRLENCTNAIAYQMIRLQQRKTQTNHAKDHRSRGVAERLTGEFQDSHLTQIQICAKSSP